MEANSVFGRSSLAANTAVPRGFASAEQFAQASGELRAALGFWSTWLQGSKRLGTPMNDIRPKNIGANGFIFDPALHPVQRGGYWFGAGTVGASAGYGVYSIFSE